MLPAKKNEKVMSILVMTLSVDLVPKLSINHYQTQKSRSATQQKTDTRQFAGSFVISNDAGYHMQTTFSFDIRLTYQADSQTFVLHEVIKFYICQSLCQKKG